MDIQTIVVWVARLACPLAIGLMVWLFLRQSEPAPEQSPAQRLSLLQQRQAALDVDIATLEAAAQSGGGTAADAAQPIEAETPTV